MHLLLHFHRLAKQAAMETIGLLVTSTPFREPPTPQNIVSTPCWTPGTDAASPPTPLVTDTVRVYNSAMDTIANLTARETKREPLISQLKTPLNNLSKAEQLNVVQKASEYCLLVSSAMHLEVARSSSSPWLSLHKEKSLTVHHLVI